MVRDDRRGVPWSKERLVCRLGYSALMGSPAWRDRRRWWRDLWVAYHGHHPSCAVCGKPWTLTNGDLHHRSYSHLGAEGWTEIVPICRRCHNALYAIDGSNAGWRRLGRDRATGLIIAQLRRLQDRSTV